MLRTILTLLVAFGLLAGLRASTVLRLDWAGVLARAELVVEGRVESVSAALDDQGRIRSTLALRVDGALRGAAPGELLELTWPGGSFAGEGELLVGLPIPEPGDELLLFLRPESRGLRLPVGLAQGVLRRWRHAPTQQVFYTRHLGELSLVDAQGAPLPAPSGAEHVEQSALRAELQRALTANAAEAGR